MIDLRKTIDDDFSESAIKFRRILTEKINRVEELNGRSLVDKCSVRLKNGLYVSVAGAVECGAYWCVPIFDGENCVAIIVPEIAAFVERYANHKYKDMYDGLVEYYERYEPMKKFRRLNLGMYE